MFHIHRSKDKQFYFTWNAKNGKVIMASETYKRKASVKKAIRNIPVYKIIKDHTA